MRRKKAKTGLWILIASIILLALFCVFMAFYSSVDRVKLDLDKNAIKYDDIPSNIINATIAVEDKRYWNHNGVDIIRTADATFNYLNPFSKSKAGGSTITQQVIKNVTGNWESTPKRKILEIIRATKLEQDYTKEEILETYLNIIALGNGLNGIHDACNFYYHKEIKDLTLEECAALICITQNPTKWDPIKNPENNKERRNFVLEKMLKQKYITKEEYEKALAN